MLAHGPMPPAVAARPRDGRGYPVPAITPWGDDGPRFSVTSVARTFLCALERRCSICGLTLSPGPVWRVVGGEEADAISAAGVGVRNAAATAEAPGHRACMLYASMVCPWLSQPTARRRSIGPAGGFEVTKGTRRGHGGAVVGYRTYDFTYTDAEGVRFRFEGVVEFLPHDRGGEHLATLQASLAVAAPVAEALPAYLLADEAAAVREFAARRRLLLGGR